MFGLSWEVLTLIAALFYGIQSLVFKYAMKDSGHAISMTWLFNIMFSVFAIVPALIVFQIPSDARAWLFMLGSAVFWAAGSYFLFKSYKITDVSLRAPVAKTEMLFAFVLAVLLLGESVSLQKIAGVFLILFGIFFLSSEGRFEISRMRKNKGVLLTVFASLIIAPTIIFDKLAIAYFHPFVYAFVITFTSALILTPFAIKERKHIKPFLLKNRVSVVLAAFIGVIAYIALISAYKITEVSNVVPVSEVSVFVAVMGGYLLHKEKNIKKRMIGAAIAFIGVLFIARPGLI